MKTFLCAWLLVFVCVLLLVMKPASSNELCSVVPADYPYTNYGVRFATPPPKVVRVVCFTPEGKRTYKTVARATITGDHQ